MTTQAIQVGARIFVEKGSKALDISKGCTAIVQSITPQGADYNYNMIVAIRFVNGFKAGKTVNLYAKHPNRLADLQIALCDGWGRGTVKVSRR